MIDDDDAAWTAMLLPDGGGWFMALLGLVVVVILLWVADTNKKECAQQHCDHGTPMLTDNECLCVDKAKEHN